MAGSLFCRMELVKVVKNKAYLKRYQVKFRRWWEGKTDYSTWKHLVSWDKNKHHTPKYRTRARVSYRDITRQTACAHTEGDVVVSATHAHEPPSAAWRLARGCNALPRPAAAPDRCCPCPMLPPGLSTGLTWTRHTKTTAGDWRWINVENAGGQHGAFACYLDAGPARTTTRDEVLGALKGTADEACLYLTVPNDSLLMVQSTRSATPQKHIMGQNVSGCTFTSVGEDEDTYKKQFSQPRRTM